ncbi:hypothetical protein PPACK8108_LOCUS20544 [Phakopsora pachyrhizi]|uniref:Uncharacterized protein n=1 Tax=Phakopsora pachyrhizi TaxID=170000 RepID=A0AAV0BHP4_PHAPC|nr:hypothetical protein PPACK8108_LOCUS20544 [Phakopsora pachyrhizi]
MTPITISMIFRIENSVCSGNQRATRSVQIAKPAYNANIVAPRAKEWDMSDDNGSTGERQHEFNYLKNRIKKMNEKVKLISNQMWDLEKKIKEVGKVKKNQSSKQQQISLSQPLLHLVFIILFILSN